MLNRTRFLLPVIALVSGCASNIPAQIRNEPVDNLSVATVSSDPEQYIGKNVRWGGSVVKVENKVDSTWIEIVSTNLGSFGQPGELDEDSQGRFIAGFDGFLDPAVFKEGRKITVYGLVENPIIGKIDEHSYSYPFVKASNHYLWSETYYSPHRYYADYPYYEYPYWWYRPYYGFQYGHRNHFWYRHGFYPEYYYY